MRMKWNEERGFSPVEVLIAMAILGIGIMAVMRLFPSGLAFSRIAQERTVASQLADKNLSRIRMAGASNLLGISRAASLYATGNQLNAYNDAMGTLGAFGRVSTLDAAALDPNKGGDTVVSGYAAKIHRVGGPQDQNLVRVTFTVDMADGRRENFVTYVTDY